jgi:hypothetical protein
MSSLTACEAREHAVAEPAANSSSDSPMVAWLSVSTSSWKAVDQELASLGRLIMLQDQELCRSTATEVGKAENLLEPRR